MVIKQLQVKKVFAFAALLISLTFLSSCKKEDNQDDDITTDNTADDASNASDFTSNSDQAIDDANEVLNNSGLSGKKEGVTAINICGSTIDSASIANKTIAIRYDSTVSCYGYYKRSGSITVTLTSGNKWSDVGATISILFSNYKVTRLADSKAFILNGTKYVTNVTGGTWRSLLANGTLTHKITSPGMELTFSDGTKRTWATNRKRTITGSGSTLQTLTVTVVVSGDSTINGVANTAFWGTTKNGDAFTATLSNISVNSICGWKRPVTGTEVITANSRSASITFGVDQNGVPVTSGCAYGYKVAWKNSKGEDKSVVKIYQ